MVLTPNCAVRPEKGNQVMATKKENHPEVVSGNRLTDGFVVYLADDGSWVERIEDAAIAATVEKRAELEAKANTGIATQKVTHWEFAEVSEKDGTRTAIKNIQYIRSLGPTVRRDLGKQADLYQSI